MEWWYSFRTVRKVVLAVASLLCLAFGIALAVYLAHEWKYSTTFQRIFLLVSSAANMFSSVLIYLMMVVVFRLWADFARVISLFALHAAIAVIIAIFGSRFSCTIFSSANSCSDVRIVSLLVSCGIAGLLLFQAVCLFIMSRVSRPIMDESNPNFWPPEHKRSSSFTSTNSSSALLRTDIEANAGLEVVPSLPSYYPQVNVAGVTALASPARPPPAAMSRTTRNYGTMSPRAYAGSPRVPQMRQMSENGRTDSPAPAYQRTRRAPPRPLLLTSFADAQPPSRGNSNASNWSNADAILSGTMDSPPRALTASASVHSIAPSLYYAARPARPPSAHVRSHSYSPTRPATDARQPGSDDGAERNHRRQSSLPAVLRSAGLRGVATPTGERSSQEYRQWRQLVMSAAIGSAL